MILKWFLICLAEDVGSPIIENMKTYIALLTVGLCLFAFTASSQTTTYGLIGVLPGSIAKIQERAASGDSAAQATLSGWLWGGQVLKKDPVQAYKWALLAADQGNKDGKFLMRELDLFLSDKDKEKGRALAKKCLADREKVPKEPPADGKK